MSRSRFARSASPDHADRVTVISTDGRSQPSTFSSPVEPSIRMVPPGAKSTCSVETDSTLCRGAPAHNGRPRASTTAIRCIVNLFWRTRRAGRRIESVQSVLIERVHGGDIGPIADGIGGGEIRGNLLCHLAGRSPFDSSLERGNEPYAAQRIDIVPERGMKDASFAVVHDQQQGFIASRAVIGGVGVGGCENWHVLAGTPEGVVEFIALVHPFFRQSFHDGVLTVSHSHLIRNPLAVAARSAGRRILLKFAVFVIPERAGGFVGIATAADADHLVVF